MPYGFINKYVVIFLNIHISFETINITNMMESMNHNPIVYDGWNLFRYKDVLEVRPSLYMGLSYTKSSIKS